MNDLEDVENVRYNKYIFEVLYYCTKNEIKHAPICKTIFCAIFLPPALHSIKAHVSRRLPASQDASKVSWISFSYPLRELFAYLTIKIHGDGKIEAVTDYEILMLSYHKRLRQGPRYNIPKLFYKRYTPIVGTY